MRKSKKKQHYPSNKNLIPAQPHDQVPLAQHPDGQNASHVQAHHRALNTNAQSQALSPNNPRDITRHSKNTKTPPPPDVNAIAKALSAIAEDPPMYDHSDRYVDNVAHPVAAHFRYDIDAGIPKPSTPHIRHHKLPPQTQPKQVIRHQQERILKPKVHNINLQSQTLAKPEHPLNPENHGVARAQSVGDILGKALLAQKETPKTEQSSYPQLPKTKKTEQKNAAPPSVQPKNIRTPVINQASEPPQSHTHDQGRVLDTTNKISNHEANVQNPALDQEATCQLQEIYDNFNLPIIPETTKPLFAGLAKNENQSEHPPAQPLPANPEDPRFNAVIPPGQELQQTNAHSSLIPNTPAHPKEALFQNQRGLSSFRSSAFLINTPANAKLLPRADGSFENSMSSPQFASGNSIAVPSAREDSTLQAYQKHDERISDPLSFLKNKPHNPHMSLPNLKLPNLSDETHHPLRQNISETPQFSQTGGFIKDTPPKSVISPPPWKAEQNTSSHYDNGPSEHPVLDYPEGHNGAYIFDQPTPDFLGKTRVPGHNGTQNVAPKTKTIHSKELKRQKNKPSPFSREEQHKRKAFRSYFGVKSGWTFLPLILGIGLISAHIRYDEIVGYGLLLEWPLFVGFACFILGLLVRFVRFNNISEKQLDQWASEDLKQLEKRALEMLGIPQNYLLVDPIVLLGLPNFDASARFFSKGLYGKDQILRYTPRAVTILCFSVDKIYVYEGVADLIKGECIHENLREFFYKDVVSVGIQKIQVPKSWLKLSAYKIFFMPWKWKLIDTFTKMLADRSFEPEGVERFKEYFNIKLADDSSIQLALRDSRLVSDKDCEEIPLTTDERVVKAVYDFVIKRKNNQLQTGFSNF
ncbi:MAG: hypothetical protein AAF228_00750 [Pseudomonadota bacterium]